MEQMSQIWRFFEIQRDCVGIKAFIELISLDGRNVDIIRMKMTTKLEKDELNIDDCKDQSYDNKATMAGGHSLAQTKILNTYQ